MARVASLRVILRRARSRDAGRIAGLSGQLGYPASATAMRRRLRRLLRQRDHEAFVASDAAGRVIGWVHVLLTASLEEDPLAEISGLVVDESHRGGGLGRLLLRRAEAWARRRGCRALRVRSNVIRRAAHRFYLREGYRIVKTQRVFLRRM